MSIQKENKPAVWQHDSLEVDDGWVIGNAYTRTFANGYSVQIAVTSYEFEHQTEIKLNHVPMVAVVDQEGIIQTEPHARDSLNPHTAIGNAKGVAEDVVRRPEDYIGSE